MEGSHYNSNSLLLPDGTSFQYDDSGFDLFGQALEMDPGVDFANLSETNIDIKDIKVDLAELEPGPQFQAIGRENGYDLYPTLPPWGHNNKFSYDEWGQLSAQTKFEKADLQDYLYNHPLRDSLIIWIQRHPSQAHLLYQTQYGASCRYRQCRPTKGNPHAITVGHYRIAIDELTGRHPKHKADTYIHAAFFHVSCFEDMLDLAQVTRDFDVRCENRPVVNAPRGEKKPKNRMLLEERRIPHAVTKWLERAREDPNWTTTKVEDGMNYLVFTQKFGLRPHRRKCTEVPGMEKLSRDISHLGAPRPVAPNSTWGGKRVKGLTVAELTALEGRDYYGIGVGKKRGRSRREEEYEDEDYSASPPARRARLNSPVGDEEDPIVLGSSKTPSPVKFQKPGKLRGDQTRVRRQRAGALERPIPAQATIPTIVKQEPEARSIQQRGAQLPENIFNASALPPGAIVRTAGGEYLRNPVTGMLEPILSVTIMDPYQHPHPTLDSSRALYPQTPVQYPVQMGFSAPASIPTPQMDYTIPTHTTPMVQTPLIDPVLRALEYSTTSQQVLEGDGETPVDSWDGSLFGDSPPPSARPATPQFELPAGAALDDLDISQYQLDGVESQRVEYVQAPAQTVPPETVELDESLFNDLTAGFPETDMDNFDISDWL